MKRPFPDAIESIFGVEDATKLRIIFYFTNFFAKKITKKERKERIEKQR